MRSTRTRTERGAGSVALAAALLVTSLACSGKLAPPIGENRPGPAQRGGTLRSAFFTDVRTLDAATASDTASATIEFLIYDTLVTYDARGELVPQLAESVDVSSDGMTYTFALRHGVLFHDATELTAEDVKRSMERALHVKTPCPTASYFERIAGYEEYHSGKAERLSGVVVTGKYGLQVRLAKPDATFLHLMATPTVAPLCKSAGSTYDAQFARQPCGAGPFRLVEYEPGDIVRVVRHDGYWQPGKPYLDGIEWSLNVQAFTQRFKFEAGDLDYMREFSDADLIAFRTSPAWQGLGAWQSALFTVGAFMNCETEPFANVHLRRAVASGIDWALLAQLRPGQVALQGHMVPDNIAGAPHVPGQHYDYQHALEEMRLAGYPYDPATARGGYPKTIGYVTLVDSFQQVAAEFYQQQLARIGIRIELSLVSFPTYLARTGRRREVAMGSAGWVADYPEPSTFFEPILTTRAIRDEESQNVAFFSNREMDALMDRARVTADATERTALYRRAEEIVTEEAPWALGYSYRFFELWQPYMHGYAPHPVLNQYMRDTWFDQGARPARTAWAPAPFRRLNGRGAARSTLAMVVAGER